VESVISRWRILVLSKQVTITDKRPITRH
jgi:hypothetical protein